MIKIWEAYANTFWRTSRTRTLPVGRARRKAASNWPGARMRIAFPNKMSASHFKDSVQNGRAKSWWSIWGGMQSPESLVTRQLAQFANYTYVTNTHINFARLLCKHLFYMVPVI